MTKAILFDFWGTLVENGVYPSPLKQVKYILWIEGSFSYFVQQFEKAFMTRKFNDLREGFQTACDALNLEYGEEQLDRLVGAWNKNKLLAKPFPETEDVLKSLKEQGYKLILVSNTDSSMNDLLDKFNLRQYFDSVLLSCDIGFLKSDVGMYEMALEQAGVAKEDALMVGDSMETDVKGAERAGIKALLIDRHDRMDHKPKIKALLEVEDFLRNKGDVGTSTEVE